MKDLRTILFAGLYHEDNDLTPEKGGYLMADLELLNKAQDYIEKLANGINPLNGEKITDESVLNNIEIIRCLFHANYVLAGY